MNQQELKSVLRYEPETGRFFWLVRAARNIAPGTEAGSGKRTHADGHTASYRYIRFEQTDYPAQRLAWLFTHGALPEWRLGFKDGDSLNCRIDNLYEMVGVKGHDFSTREGRMAYQKAIHASHPKRYREAHLQARFGIGLREYEAMFLAQKGCCAICDKPETATRKGKPIALAVDHHHATGTVRQLLCAACNKLIGLAEERRDVLLSAVRYLDRHAGTAAPVPMTLVKGG